jgi:hypothetical protein
MLVKEEVPVSERGWVRSGGVVGIISMATLLAGVVSGPNKLISTDSSVAKIVSDVGSDTAREAVSGGLAIVGAALFVWFAATLASRLSVANDTGPLGSTVLAASIIVFVFGSLDNIVLNVLGFLSRQGSLTSEPELTRLLYHFYNGLFMPGLAAFGFSLYFVAVGLGALMGRIRPRWLTWPSLLLAPLALVNGFVGITMTNGGANPVAPIAILGFVVVTMSISIVMLRDKPRSAE